MTDILAHYGTPRRSGRYPWGSGEDPYQNNKSFLGYVNQMKKEGLTESEIAQAIGYSTTELRAKKAIANREVRESDKLFAQKLKDKNYSNVAIAERLGISEGKVRNLLKESEEHKQDVLFATADVLKQEVADKKYLDFGAGTEQELGISNTKLNTAVAMLKEEGYNVYYVKVEQLGTGNKTTIKVLTPPGVDYSEVMANRADIKPITAYTEDNGLTYLNIKEPKPINQKRLMVNYDEDGGSTKDGVIELRRGVDDLDLGDSRYAQVRIQIGDGHFLKGMAMYSDDLPDGVDIRFNTNKKKGTNKLDALKELKRTADGEIDMDNPFGATIKRQKGGLNIVNEEGDWDTWSKTLSSQMLSKQSSALAKKQLGLSFDQRKEELEEILALTNPVIKKKLLESYSDAVDSDAVHLKAAALPRQRTQVILPMNSMKETEIYAPNFRDGERVVLIRYPHGGKFEIPELTVNNKNRKARRAIGADATDAIGINHNVAARLSGADFDGDTVLVIPNNSGAIRTQKPLEGLKGFDPKASYPLPKGKTPIKEKRMQTEMGMVSNLISDMTIQGATAAELERAVRHSMVVIDSYKHKLDYKKSKKDNNIAQLEKKYQPKANGRHGGASTLISRASSEERVRARKPRSFSKGGPIDKKTGKLVYEDDGPETYTNKKGEVKRRTTKSTKMMETDDAFSLVSPNGGTPIETVYATHANKLKAIANQARLQSIRTPSFKYSPSARKTYSKEVESLNAKLNMAKRNAPLERRAQIVANATVKEKMRDRPGMEYDDLKKVRGQALSAARNRVGAKKQQIVITPKEWEAIQAGAISGSKLRAILDNTDLDKVKEYATPRSKQGLTPSKKARAKALLANGYTTAEVADAVGVSSSTLNKELNI